MKFSFKIVNHLDYMVNHLYYKCMDNAVETLKELIEAFGRTNNKYNLLNKKTRDYCTGVDFPPSEINTLVMIKKYKENNITELGRLLGVSKSAASQIIFKLEKKGVIKKYKDADNSKNIIIGLTDLGNVAVKTYEEYRMNLFGSLIQSLNDMTAEQVETVKGFLNQVENLMDEHL